MKKKINSWIGSLSESNHFEFYSSVFRIFICVYILASLYNYWDYFPIIFSGKSFYSAEPTYLLEIFGINSSVIRDHINLYIFVYVILVGLFALGIGRHYTAFLLFVFFEISQRLCYVVLNGGDNLLKFCLMYMIFIDSYKYFTIVKTNSRDRLDNNKGYFISNLAGYLICIHLCIVYFFSAFHKIHADVWYNGIATYYTLSLERFKGTPFNDSLARNGVFVTLSTYFVLLLEISYPYLIWNKKARPFIIFSAILMHAGIFFFMMIYGFQLVFIAIQGFFIPNQTWINYYNKISNKFLLFSKGKIKYSINSFL